MSGSIFTFTASSSIAPGQYSWNNTSNWVQNGASGLGTAEGQTGVALITAPGSYTVNLDFDINGSYGGLGALEITNATATVALGINNLTLTDAADFSGNSPGTGTPLQELAGTITDAGGTFIADDTAQVTGLGTMLVDGAIIGFGTIEANFAGTGEVQASGGTLEITNALTAAGPVFQVGTAAGSVLQLDSTVAAGVVTDFVGGTGALEILNPGAFAATIDGLKVGASVAPTTNYVDVQETVTNATLIGNTITLFDLSAQVGTLVLGSAPVGVTYAEVQADALLGGTDIFLSTVCYANGTHLLTDQGEVAVERITQGMRVITLQGTEQVPMPVTWVGRMRVNLARHPRPELAAPVRIRRHAFAEDVPHRDLLVSPDHCLFIDGRLFVARSLINGTSIVQDMSRSAVEYFHIETERHAVVLAEGLPAETYLDTGNRAYFDNSGIAFLLHPEFTVNAGLRCWAEDACAPLAIAPEAREPVWRRLADRAETLGFVRPAIASTRDPDLRLALPGAELRPIAVGPDRYVFLLPRHADAVRLRSRANCPTELWPWIEDQRRLGVSVARIVLRAGDRIHELPPDDPALTTGWWAAEGGSADLSRWTDGDAELVLPPLPGPIVMEVHLRHRTDYVHAEPLPAEMDRAAA